MDLTEKTLSRKDIYDGRIVHLHVDEVALPDGSRSVREVIDHCPCVAVLALDEQNRVFILFTIPDHAHRRIKAPQRIPVGIKYSAIPMAFDGIRMAPNR